jgi:hypothetical protein
LSWRGYPKGTADERTQLIAYIDRFRDAIVTKIEGLTEEQARWRPAPTANSLLNLVVHLTGVERNWFQHWVAGRTVERDRDAELAELPPEVTIATAVEAYRRVCAESNQILGGASMDDLCKGGDAELSVRFVALHMLEETARHAGHADITRELIDGSVGDD